MSEQEAEGQARVRGRNGKKGGMPVRIAGWLFGACALLVYWLWSAGTHRVVQGGAIVYLLWITH